MCLSQSLIHMVKIDSITQSFCLCYYVQNGLSYLGEETWLTLCKKDAKRGMASSLLEQIKISCYTEYKAFGPSLIYNIHSVSWKIPYDTHSMINNAKQHEANISVIRYNLFSFSLKWNWWCLTLEGSIIQLYHLKEKMQTNN